MSHDPIEQRIARALQAKADEVPVRDRLGELERAQRRTQAPRWSVVAAAAAFIAVVATVGGSLLLIRNTTTEPVAETTTDTPTSSKATPSTGDELTIESLYGIWALDSFTVDGESRLVEVEVNTAGPPWAELSPDGLSGNLGCNRFGSLAQPTLTEGMLDTGGAWQTWAGCAALDSTRNLLAVEEVFAAVAMAQDGIEVQLTVGGMSWTAGNTTLFFSLTDEVPVATTTSSTAPIATTAELREERGTPGQPFSICGTAPVGTELRVTFTQPTTGDTWPDDVDERTQADDVGDWCWNGTFPIELTTADTATSGELRPITPGLYEVTVESAGELVLATLVDVLPGYSESDRPSQSPEDAARDQVVAGLAELPMAKRVGVRFYEATPEGVWVLNVTEIYETIPGPCDDTDPDCVYGREFIFGGSYAELLLMDSTGREILKAYPMPNIVPDWMYVDEGYVYTGRIGDGAVPQNSLIRVDRASRAMDALIFEDPEDEYAWFGEVVANGEWLNGWQVLTYDEGGTPWFLTVNENTIDGVPAPANRRVFINLNAIEAIFAAHS